MFIHVKPQRAKDGEHKEGRVCENNQAAGKQIMDNNKDDDYIEKRYNYKAFFRNRQGNLKTFRFHFIYRQRCLFNISETKICIRTLMSLICHHRNDYLLKRILLL